MSVVPAFCIYCRQIIRPKLTNADIDQIIDGIEQFIIEGDASVRPIWQPYIDKLQALKENP